MTQVLCIGQAVQDFVFSVDEFPAEPDKYPAAAFESVGGGPAATAAVAISRLGGVAQLAARVGDDALGTLIIEELESYGVDCALVKRMTGRQSSVSAVLVDNSGERLIVNYLNPNMASEPDWLFAHLPTNLSAVLTDTRWPEAAQRGLQLARRKNLPAVLDADVPVPVDGELVRAATHVAFSKSGLTGFSGIEDAETALRHVSEQTDAWCCVTLGEQGTMIIDHGQVTHRPAFDVAVRDTLGAGDVWHGAFALALAEGKPTLDALTFATAAAALKVQHGGGRAGCPTRSDVEEFLQQRVTGSIK